MGSSPTRRTAIEMATEPPIACSLTGPEMSVRLAEISAVGHDALLSSTSTDDGAVLRLQPGAQIRARVEELMRAEKECCPFLDFDLGESDSALVLTIRSPEAGRAVVQELVAAFGSS